jgi:hypothetical protein
MTVNFVGENMHAPGYGFTAFDAMRNRFHGFGLIISEIAKKGGLHENSSMNNRN